MPKLVLEPTSTAQWQALVAEAAATCNSELEEELESYLVFLLMRFMGRPEFVSRIMALEYLRGMSATGQVQVEQLRDVGDQCLLYSGLYPRQATRRLVRVSYFVNLGRSAYSQLSDQVRHAGADMYAALADAFVGLMDVLQTMREFGTDAAMTPLEAVELWQDTQSERARRILEQATQGSPAWPPSHRTN